MNSFSSWCLVLQVRAPTSLSGSVSRRLLNAMTILWRNAHLGPTIAFLTGVLVGLLIPSREWFAIITVVALGALVQSFVEAIGRKCAGPPV
jgi:hypothetical protein